MSTELALLSKTKHLLDKDLFDLFVNTKPNYELFISVSDLIAKKIHDAKGRENAMFYDVLRRLSDSINNAGWQERHSQQIALIDKASGDIADKYERFLP